MSFRRPPPYRSFTRGEPEQSVRPRFSIPHMLDIVEDRILDFVSRIPLVRHASSFDHGAEPPPLAAARHSRKKSDDPGGDQIRTIGNVRAARPYAAGKLDTLRDVGHIGLARHS